jgi:hypothetical protein
MFQTKRGGAVKILFEPRATASRPARLGRAVPRKPDRGQRRWSLSHAARPRGRPPRRRTARTPSRPRGGVVRARHRRRRRRRDPRPDLPPTGRRRSAWNAAACPSTRRPAGPAAAEEMTASLGAREHVEAVGDQRSGQVEADAARRVSHHGGATHHIGVDAAHARLSSFR